MMNTSYAAAQTQAFFAQRFPEIAPLVAPHLDALFSALAKGHSAIWLSEEEAIRLSLAAPIVGHGKAPSPLVLRGKRLTTGRIDGWEQSIAQHLYRIANAAIRLPETTDIGQKLQTWFADPHSKAQQEAAALALLQPFMLITGGPGTGKTTTVASLLALLASAQADSLPRIALAAPTGKAAARMTQSLQNTLPLLALDKRIFAHLSALEGQTLHRLLARHPQSGKAKYHAEHSLPYDVIVVDEVSMVDLPLAAQLFAAVATGSRLILLGDTAQLPSVGIGQLLADLAETHTTVSPEHQRLLQQWLPESQWQTPSATTPPLASHSAMLHISRRFDPEKGIGALARAIIEGNSAAIPALFDAFPQELTRLPENSHHQAEHFYKLNQPYWQAVAKGDIAACFEQQQAHVALTAYRQDAERFNQDYLTVLGQSADKPFAGQVIMISANDYSTRLFNGDIGIILSQNNEPLMAWFADGQSYRPVALGSLPGYQTAFAITVHKSQGSEYDHVWLLAPEHESNESSTLFNRSLLYTALTRAKKSFAYAGSLEGLSAASQRQQMRQSGLKSAIKHQWQQEAT